jgi:parvulin-like peptidyl-prolyl isomerase
LFAVLRRAETPAEMADAIFTAAAGDVVGPVRADDGYAVVRVLDFVPARLDEPTRRTITKLLFEAWLEERRRSARVEWNWGTVNRTEWEGMAAAG